MRREAGLIPVVAEGIAKVHGVGRRRVVALDDVSVEVRTGQVIALLGRNGAGKSSLLRILSGRDGADRGRATVYGHDLSHDHHRAAPLTGVLVDRPGFLGGLSVHANLELVARRHGLGGPPVGELLERCGLDRTARSRTVAACSLGMRQRLGIAAALLGSPPLLILDEPTNGLDPAGIAWVRDLVRAHADDGGAVLLASHLMGEVDAVADEVVVLRDGRVAHRGTPSELARSVAVPMRLRTAGPPADAARVLAVAGVEVLDVRAAELHLRPTSSQVERLSLVLAEAGIAVVSLVPTVSPLEVLLAADEAS